MTEKTKLNELRKNLQEALSENDITFDDVLNLSNDLLKLDTNNVRFSTDAGIIDRLGKELVGRQETAVCELVKNSFDADATLVTLTFENFEKKGGTLTIDDNGNGMSRDELIRGFMRLSSSDKVSNPVSPLFKRKRAGRKGIGRFATQRLGGKLTIITQTDFSSDAIKVQFNWSKFTADTDLISISSKIEETLKTKQKGTTLIIESLEDSWTEASVRRIFRYLIDLIQPFPLSNEKIKSVNQNKEDNKEDVDPGFNIKIFTKVDEVESEIASAEQNIFEYAVAEIEGLVEQGKGIWTVKSSLLNIDEVGQTITPNEKKPEKLYKHLSKVNFKAYYFIQRVGNIPPIVKNFLDEFLKERGGIRVYRNGFRVLPYGEQFNDWLRLDFSSGRRLVLPPFSNENFFGFVEITDERDETFQETSSREGLIDNEAFKELVDFIFKVLRASAYRIAEIRDRKKTASQKNWEKPKKTPSEIIDEQLSNLNKLAENLKEGDAQDNKNGEGNNSNPPTENTSDSNDDDFAGKLKEGLQIISDAKSQDDKDKEQLLEEISLLRVLAGLGLSIAIFTHEVKNTYNAISNDTATLIKNTSNKEHEIAKRLNKHLNSFKTYTAYFDSIVSKNVHRELAIQNISQIARTFVKTIKPAADKYSIKLHEPIVEGLDIFSCKMHWSEWMSILLNFFTNSTKAIKRASEDNGEIQIKVGKTKDLVFLEFSDNGDGVPSESQERIFEPFFTTSSPAGPIASDTDELTGTGLGLKIVKDTVISYEGEIKLVLPPIGYNTCFRVEVPSATIEEINEYGY